MTTIVYILVFIVLIASLYVLIKILNDGKKALLKRMLDNKDITKETYLKYLEKL
jgi:hypothetical protein